MELYKTTLKYNIDLSVDEIYKAIQNWQLDRSRIPHKNKATLTIFYHEVHGKYMINIYRQIEPFLCINHNHKTATEAIEIIQSFLLNK